MTTNTTIKSAGSSRYVIVAVLVVAAFFGAYRFASAGSARQLQTADGGAGAPVTQAALGTDASTPGCACCGSTAPTENGITGTPVEGAATVDGDVQRIEVDLSTGIYQPNVLKLKAGVPAEITFGQSSGCTGQVMSKSLGFFEDLTGGPRTVSLDGLEAGEYEFSCGMSMVFGKIVVE